MNRLTGHNYEHDLFRDIYCKLQYLEDIEEELGIEFITLIKMLKNDVYINDGGIVDEIGNIYTAQVKSIEHWPVWGFTAGDNVEYAFKDRGRTWALSKEEFYETLSKQKNQFTFFLICIIILSEEVE